jgi:hypothetical protein
MQTSPNLGLTIWDLTTDYFSRAELQANWEAIDDHDHTPGKGAQIGVGGIANLAIGSAQLQDNSVTTAKIPNLGVTTAKINDLAITTGKLGAGVVTPDKVAARPQGLAYRGTAQSISNNLSTVVGLPSEFGTTRDMTYNGTNGFTIATTGWYAVTIEILWAGGAGGSVRNAGVTVTGGSGLGYSPYVSINRDPSSTPIDVISTGITQFYSGNLVQIAVSQNSGGALNLNRASLRLLYLSAT